MTVVCMRVRRLSLGTVGGETRREYIGINSSLGWILLVGIVQLPTTASTQEDM